jgi:hypothetical protein
LPIVSLFKCSNLELLKMYWQKLISGFWDSGISGN